MTCYIRIFLLVDFYHSHQILRKSAILDNFYSNLMDLIVIYFTNRNNYKLPSYFLTLKKYDNLKYHKNPVFLKKFLLNNQSDQSISYNWFPKYSYLSKNNPSNYKNSRFYWFFENHLKITIYRITKYHHKNSNLLTIW